MPPKAKRKPTRKSRPLIAGHLEKVSIAIFKPYQKQITDLVQGHHGVYALYRRDKLYYIGLATDLKRRLGYHLNDRHQKKWDRFSLYITAKSDHLRELEALLLRIADPTANNQRGKLKKSTDLMPALNQSVKDKDDQERAKLFGKKRPKRTRCPKPKTPSSSRRRPARPLKGFFPVTTTIYATYKGRKYTARVSPSGLIRLQGRSYNSPSGAGKAICKRTVPGWNFWKYKNKSGTLIPIDELRE